MDDYILHLSPQPFHDRTAPPAELPLSSQRDAGGGNGQRVFSDFAYQGTLSWSDSPPVTRVTAFQLNKMDVPLAGCRQDGENALTLQFDDRQIFNDTFGCAAFTVSAELADGRVLTLQSEFIPIYVNTADQHSDRTLSSLREMAQFIQGNCAPFWPEDRFPALGEELPSQVQNVLRLDRPQTMTALIQLLGRIVRGYQDSLPCFRTGAKYRVRPERQWVDFERAASLNSATFHSILQRPCYLARTDPDGIRLPGREGAYTPAKVVANAGQVDYNIYENRYILGFLRYLLGKTVVMARSLDEQRRAAQAPAEAEDGYVNSMPLLTTSAGARIQANREALEDARRRLSTLYAAYRQVLPVTPDKVRDGGAPRGTPIFRSVHYYHSLYALACQWFRFGVYDFQREGMVLPFIAGHKLYEYYVLLKLLCHLQGQGFRFTGAEAVRWEREVPAGQPNLFSFRREEQALTVYYESRIYPGAPPAGLPDVGLRRTDTSTQYPYKPDYVLKLQTGGRPAEYVILDAKFASQYTAQHRRMLSLISKYLCSLEPARPGERILGLCLPYGKPDGQDHSHSPVTRLFDCGWENAEYWPFVRLAALRTDNEAVHEAALAEALRDTGLEPRTP